MSHNVNKGVVVRLSSQYLLKVEGSGIYCNQADIGEGDDDKSVDDG